MDWGATLERLKGDRGNWSAIARATGLSGNQIRRIANGETKRPGIDTCESIVAYYSARDAGNAPAPPVTEEARP